LKSVRLSIKKFLKTDNMKRIIIVIVALGFLIVISQIFFKSLQFDLINGGGNLSSSASKGESVKRGVYICDLELVSFYRTGDSINFKTKEAWVEKIWRDGVWYWTTQSEDIGYQIKIRTSLTDDQQARLHMINNRISALGNYEGLGCCCGECSGSIKELPKSDTIRYNVLRKNNLDFSDSNVIGELVFVLKRN